MKILHERILLDLPKIEQRFFDGKNSEGEIVTNPTIGYGSFTRQMANGKSQEWFRIGISANKSGISVYILGIKDKTYLPQTYGKSLGKATITGYCIKFKALEDIELDVLASAIKAGAALTN